MIDKISEKLTDYFVKERIIRPEEISVYQYGFDITIYTLLSTAGLILLGAVLGYFMKTVILVLGVYLFQTIGGGYHANSHIRCFASMAFGLCCGLLLLQIAIDYKTLAILSVIPFGILMIKPLVLHKNKQYLREKSESFQKLSKIITLLFFGVEECMCVIDKEIGKGLFTVMLLSSISRIAGLIEERKHNEK